MKPLLVAYHFQSNVEVTFVIVGLNNLPETALSNDFEHFIAIGQMVMSYMRVRPLIVVVPAVVGTSNDAGPLLGISPNEVDLRIVEDLVVLVRREFVHVKFHHLKILKINM